MSVQFQSAAGINQIQAPRSNRIEEMPDFPPMPVSEPKQSNSCALIGTLVGLAGVGIASVALHKNYVNKKQVAKLLGENKSLTEKLKAAEEKLAQSPAEKEVKEHWWNRFGTSIKDKYSSAKEKISSKWKKFREPKPFDGHKYYSDLQRSTNPTFWDKIKNFFSRK